MGWQELLSFIRILVEDFITLADVLAWPMTVIVLILILRPHILKLFSDLSSLRYKDFEAKFNRELRQAEQQAAYSRTTPAARESLAISDMESERLLRIAEISPRAAIAEAWCRVEESVLELAEKADVDASPRRGIAGVIRALGQERECSRDTLALLNTLSALRNEAVHGPEGVLDEEEAKRYIALALTVKQQLRERSEDGGAGQSAGLGVESN